MTFRRKGDKAPATSSKVKPRLTRLVIIIVAVGVIIAAVALVVQKNDSSNDKNKPAANSKEVSALLKRDDCKNTIDELSKVKADKKDTKRSTILLSYRGSCYYHLRQYPEALTNYEQLRDIYKTTGDPALASTDDIIKEIKIYIDKGTSAPTYKGNEDVDDMSPAFKKQIKEQYGDN